MEKYTKFLTDPTINMQTIKVNDVIAGSVAKFLIENEAGITYWLDRIFGAMELPHQHLKTFYKLNKSDQFMDVLHLTIMAHKKF
jgi:[ribosomal protein S5]-alanine N-acetyltransferase